MDDDQEAPKIPKSDDDQTILINRMLEIPGGERQGIGENGCRFLKRDTVLQPVADCLLFIPIKPVRHRDAS